MRIGSLFSGIGGFELGLERAGLGHTVWQVEIDPFCRRVLARHWPNAVRYEDVRDVGASTLAPVDLLCGGFPCQDVSHAGKRVGLDGARSGLWFEYRRIVEELHPPWVAVENTAGLVRRGLATVENQLRSLGYEVERTRIRAEDVAAPHRRERLFLVAHTHRTRQPQCQGQVPEERGRSGHSRQEVAHAHSKGRGEGRDSSQDVSGETGSGAVVGGGAPQYACIPRAVESPMGRGPDGFPRGLDRTRWPLPPGPDQHAWEPPRTVEPRSIEHRPAMVKALGNAVVPACAYIVGMRIRQHLEAA